MSKSQGKRSRKDMGLIGGENTRPRKVRIVSDSKTNAKYCVATPSILWVLWTKKSRLKVTEQISRISLNESGGTYVRSSTLTNQTSVSHRRGTVSAVPKQQYHIISEQEESPQFDAISDLKIQEQSPNMSLEEQSHPSRPHFQFVWQELCAFHLCQTSAGPPTEGI